MCLASSKEPLLEALHHATQALPAGHTEARGDVLFELGSKPHDDTCGTIALAAIGTAFAISFVCNTVEVRLVTVGRILGLHTVLLAHDPWQMHLQGLLDWMYAGLEVMRTNIAQVHCTLLTPR